jgi:hypothetical protein
MIGGPQQPLAPLRRLTTHILGPYRAVLAPTQAIQQTNEVPQELELALLTKAPNLDGLNWIELDAPGYARQDVTMTMAGMFYVANANEIVVSLEQTVEGVSHIGLFTKDGVLAFYGKLVGMGYGANAPAEFRFPVADLKGKAYAMKVVAA